MNNSKLPTCLVDDATISNSALTVAITICLHLNTSNIQSDILVCMPLSYQWSPNLCSEAVVDYVGWLDVFNVPSTMRSFRDGAPIYCPLRTPSSVFTTTPPGIEPRAVAWQSITQPLHHASSTDCVGKPRIFIQCPCLIAPLSGYMNRHSEEPR